MHSPDIFSRKSVLVTGAGGFIGSNLCRHLIHAGAEVHGVYRDASQTERDPLVRWWKGELSDFGSTRDLLKRVKPDIIFHLASYVAGSRDLELVLPTFNSNLAGSVNLLTAATELGCQRIIITGSMEEPAGCDSLAIPASPYAAAKWAGSAYARMFHALYGTPVAIARVFMVYGPGQRDLAKLVPYTVLALHRHQIPKLTSGTRQIDWIYVDDVANGLLAMAQAPDIEGRTMDLGSGATVSIQDIVLRLVAIMQADIEPDFGSLPDRPMEQVRVADINDTFAKTGWKPETALEQGLKATAAWYRSHHG